MRLALTVGRITFAVNLGVELAEPAADDAVGGGGLFELAPPVGDVEPDWRQFGFSSERRPA